MSLTEEQITALSYAQVDRMSGDEYKQNLSNPTFVTKVNELLAAAPRKPVRA